MVGQFAVGGHLLRAPIRIAANSNGAISVLDLTASTPYLTMTGASELQQVATLTMTNGSSTVSLNYAAIQWNLASGTADVPVPAGLSPGYYKLVATYTDPSVPAVTVGAVFASATTGPQCTSQGTFCPEPSCPTGCFCPGASRCW